MLGGHIGGFERRCDEPVRRCDIDDATPLVVEHRRQNETSGMKGGRQIDRHDGVPLFGRKLLQRRNVLDAGIVHKNVEPAVGLQYGFDHLADGGWLRHVGGGISRADFELRDDFRLRARDLVGLAEPVEDDVRTGGGQGLCNAQSDAAGRARDQRYLAVERSFGTDIMWLDGDIHGPQAPDCCDHFALPARHFARPEPCRANAHWLTDR